MQPIKLLNLGLMGASTLYAAIYVAVNGQVLITYPFIYNLNPWSLVVFCGFLAYLTLYREFSWWGIPTAAMAGMLFDFGGSMIAGYRPDNFTFLMWVYCPGILYFVIRPKLSFNYKSPWLPWYIAFYGLANHLQGQFWAPPSGLIFESAFEIFWCFVFLKMFVDKSEKPVYEEDNRIWPYHPDD